MRTREKKLSDYGITEERGRELLRLAALEENRQAVCEAAEESNPYLAPYLVKSLRQGVGYYQVMGAMYFRPCTAADFYGYRRKTLAAFDKLLTGKEDRTMVSLLEEGQGRMALKQP